MAAAALNLFPHDSAASAKPGMTNAHS